jgi:glycosyltransferase involved in cell wall biosynthesis
MKVSIIIPVYNAEKYLNECLESALNQTYDNIEIIAINDGSTDKSLQILNKFSNRIKVISKSNGGTASALNEGINHMSGEWFKWLSADDLLYPTAVEDIILEAKKFNDKEVRIFYTNYDVIDSNGNIINQVIEPNYNEFSSFDFNIILLDHFVGNASTSLIHKSALEKYGLFDETVGYAEDYELWLRYCILYRCRLHLIPKILGKYRIHETQLTKKVHDNAFQNSEKIKQKILKKLNSKEKEKYKIALKEFKKLKPLGEKIKPKLKNILLNFFPNSLGKKIISTYRILRYR